MDSDFRKGASWAILPAHYEAIAEQYQAAIADTAIMKEAAAYTGKEGEIKLNIRDGVAIINISGTITSQTSFFSWLYGGAAIPAIRSELEAALNNPAVKSIVLNINSPGGTVAGVNDLAEYIKGIQKPVIAYSDGLMCSAAMWIGSAADKIVIGKTAEAGSIGVLMVHTDYSGMDKEMGIKSTVLKAGKYKALGNSYEPLSKEAEDTIQAELDYLYSIFVEAIATNKKITVDEALKMADGKIFIGQQAVDIGLVNQIGTMETAIQTALSLGKSDFHFFIQTGKKRKKLMTTNFESVKELKSAFPELANELVKEGAASVDVDGKVKAEVDRIFGLIKIEMPEAGEKFIALVASGVTVDQYTAIKALQPAQPKADDKDIKKEILDELKKANTEDVGQGKADSGPKTFMEAWQSSKKSENCDTQKAMSMAAKQYPELYKKHAEGK